MATKRKVLIPPATLPLESVSEPPKSEERIFLGKYSEEYLKDVISYILSQDRIRAASEFKKKIKCDTETAIISSGKIEVAVLDILRGGDEDFIMNHIPPHTCLDCVGVCGLRHSYIGKNIWEPSSASSSNAFGRFRGVDCSNHIFEDNFVSKKRVKIILQERNAKNSTVSPKIINYVISENITTINEVVKKSRNNMIIQDRLTKLIVSPEKALWKIVLKLRRGKYHMCQNAPHEVDLLIAGEHPVEGESYKQYYERCQKTIREKRKVFLSSIYSLEDVEEVYSQIMEKFKDSSAQKVIEKRFNNNISDFLLTVYPGKDPWQILESLKREG